jgi:hypothetical protein
MQFKQLLETLEHLELGKIAKGPGHRLFFKVVERLLTLELISMLIWVLTDNPAHRFYEALRPTGEIRQL